MLTTDLYKYSPDAVPPIHAMLYHVATDKPTAQNGDKFRSIFIDNLQPIATRGKKARGTLLVDQHCGNDCSIIKCAPLSVSYYNEISGGILGGRSFGGVCQPSTAPVVLTLIYWQIDAGGPLEMQNYRLSRELEKFRGPIFKKS